MMLKLYTRFVCGLTLMCLGVVHDLAAASQPNKWTSSSPGFWQTSNTWSLGVPPSTVNQTGIFITNAVSKTVTINATTPVANRTINDLTVTAPSGSINTLQITNAGLASPVRILNGC